VVILEDNRFFSIGKNTQYCRETGRDPVGASAAILTPGTAIMAVGQKDKDGELVASRVNALYLNVLPDPLPPRVPRGADKVEWGTTAVIEGIDGDRILLDQNRYIPIGAQTKFYINNGTALVPATRAAVSKGAPIYFTLSGRRAVLMGQASGEVTVPTVTVRPLPAKR
jgi:hypothetical protein